MNSCWWPFEWGIAELPPILPRHDVALRLALDAVVANGAGGVECLLDVARLDNVLALVGPVSPYAGFSIEVETPPVTLLPETNKVHSALKSQKLS